LNAPDEALAALEARNQALATELEEATATLEAIRNGEVDAVVVGGPAGQIVYTLENADRPYRVIVEQMREGAVTLGGDGTILYCNQSFAKLIDQPSERVVGESIFDFVAEHTVLQTVFGGATTAGRSIELTLLTPLGDPVPSNVSVVELTVEFGSDRMLCMIVTDLRQNYERAREVAEANHRLALEVADRIRIEESLVIALDAAEMGSWDLDLESGKAVRSVRHDAIFGHETPLAEWSLDHALAHFIPADREAVADAFRSAEKAGRLDFERRIHRANDGAVRWVHVRGRTFYLDGRPERIAGIVSDNTERRLVEEQLRQSQKMEAIGQLTGGVAHDFNNLLMIIGGSLESLARRTQLGERAQKMLDAAQVGVARGAKLNQQLLSFARRQDMHSDVVCLTDLLPTFETLLDRAIGEGVTVETDQEPDLWSCRTDAHQLETAILNLAFNARDAMNNSGRLSLATRNVTIGEDEARRFDAKAGDYVAVSVADTGPGLEPEIAARVFEPFFTTKELGKGTGLGLSQVYGFARQSGGFVRFDSVLGQGTTVSIHLPRAEPVAAAAAALDRQPAPIREDADGAVLLVEDDADVRAAAGAMLEELGYEIVEVASGDQALNVLEAGRRVDIVFTDVIMASGMSGIELAQAIRARRPDLPVLLTSGYTAQKLNPASLDGDLPLLRKPYTLAQLSDALSGLRRGAGRPRPGDVPGANA
jgi:PAS domain S-box-containing protein